MKTQICLGLTLAALWTLPAAARAPDASAAQKVCPHTAFQAALKATDTISDWNQLHQLYLKYKPCDLGSVSGNFTYNITRLLMHHWDKVAVLADIADKDKTFGLFIAGHLNQMLNPRENDQIYRHVVKSCPQNATGICIRIRDALDANKIVRRRFRMAD